MYTTKSFVNFRGASFTRRFMQRVLIEISFHRWMSTCVLSVILATSICLKFRDQITNIASHDAHVRKVDFKSVRPSVEIFAAPPPLDRESKIPIRRAVSSWRALHPRPAITLLGRTRGLAEFAERNRVNHDPLIDQNFLGRPLFNSIIFRANRSKADITVFINADIILLQDFIRNLEKLYFKFPHFFAVGARYDIDKFPDEQMVRPESIRSHLLNSASLHNYGGMDFWAWTTGGPRLVSNSIPPFVYARGRYDNWFMHEVSITARRPVIDLSETVISVHVRHTYNQSIPLESVTLALAPMKVKKRVAHAREKVKSTFKSNFWSRGKLSNFELFLNIHLSVSVGSYHDGYGTTRHAQWKMMSCSEAGNICLIRRRKPGSCICEYAPDMPMTQLAPKQDRLGRPTTFSIKTKDDNVTDFELPVQVTRYSARNPRFGLPLTLLDALASVMENGTVVVSAVNFSYRFVMMNWVCQMRRLGIKNFIIAALDKELYRYAYRRGIAVYFEDSFDKGIGQHVLQKEGIYGSEHFQRLTKMKTRVVSRILRLGYDVIWSDCDIVYFKSPLTYLMNQQGDIVTQSNAPDGTAANGIRRINSGFYLARSSEKVIEMFDAVISLAMRSNITEQPCFYDVLCGNNGAFRKGKDGCLRNAVHTNFLSRNLFPNGITGDMWNSDPGKVRVLFPDTILLHNNWVAGIHEKNERMIRHGFNIFDTNDNVCHFHSFGKSTSYKDK